MHRRLVVTILALGLALAGCGGGASDDKPDPQARSNEGSQPLEAAGSRRFLAARDEPVELAIGGARYRVRLLASELNVGDEIGLEPASGETFVLAQLGVENLSPDAPAPSLAATASTWMVIDRAVHAAACKAVPGAGCLVKTRSFPDAEGEPGATNGIFADIEPGNTQTFWVAAATPVEAKVTPADVRVLVGLDGAKYVTAAESPLERTLGYRLVVSDRQADAAPAGKAHDEAQEEHSEEGGKAHAEETGAAEGSQERPVD